MTEKEAAKVATILKGHEADIAEAASHARALFTGGLPAFLDPPAFGAWLRRWSDHVLHDGLSGELRAGAALRTNDMRTLAPGLLAPGHYLFDRRDLPMTANAVEPFLRNLIGRPAAPADSSRKSGDAITHATRHIGDLADLAARTWKLREHSVDLYQLALLGDVTACRPLIERIDDPAVRHEAIKVVAMLQIIWAAADVQRVAAYCTHKVQLRYVPFFLRPFVRTGTAAEYLGLMNKMRHLRERLSNARTDAEVFGKPRARVTNKGGALTVLEHVVAPLENVLSPEHVQDIRDRDHWMTTESDHAVTSVEAEIARHGDGKASEQLTRFQVRHTGLSELAALMVTSYRFAEREAAMLEVIADPTRPDRLWNVTDRRFPTRIDEVLSARATAIHDSYRRHILRDNHLNDVTADDRAAGQYARTAMERAQAFLVKLGAATFEASGRMNRTGLTDTEYFTAHMLDLSERVRFGEWRGNH